MIVFEWLHKDTFEKEMAHSHASFDMNHTTQSLQRFNATNKHLVTFMVFNKFD